MIAEVMSDAEALVEFVDLFLVNAAERITQIGQVLDCGDLKAAGREAHTLVGTAGNFGAFRLSGLAGELREACDTGNEHHARDIAAGLTAALDTAAAGIRDWLDRKTTPHAA
jgi:HPt (histidine-containing phosphotransfer) domain-containing protein